MSYRQGRGASNTSFTGASTQQQIILVHSPVAQCSNVTYTPIRDLYDFRICVTQKGVGVDRPPALTSSY